MCWRETHAAVEMQNQPACVRVGISVETLCSSIRELTVCTHIVHRPVLPIHMYITGCVDVRLITGADHQLQGSLEGVLGQHTDTGVLGVAG